MNTSIYYDMYSFKSLFTTCFMPAMELTDEWNRDNRTQTLSSQSSQSRLGDIIYQQITLIPEATLLGPPRILRVSKWMHSREQNVSRPTGPMIPYGISTLKKRYQEKDHDCRKARLQETHIRIHQTLVCIWALNHWFFSGGLRSSAVV